MVLERRLERYLRGVRAEQVKLRAALKGHGALLQFFEVDEDLADREAEELRAVEAVLPQQDRLGRHWSGLPEGLKSVAEAVGFAADYTVQYRAHSGSAHANRVWDMLEVDLSNPIVFPKSPIAGTGVPLAFDALRYIGLLLRAAHTCGAVQLYRSEQATLDGVKQYLQPMDVLFANGTLGSRRRDEDSTTPEATGGSV